ncbi:MAG: multicopper oxidase domain-containing protein [Thermodesulfobacteriota bacterium]
MKGNSVSRKAEQRLARYMKEIRDAGKSGLSRRELMRWGLVAGGAGAAAIRGIRNFKPHWAHAALRNGNGELEIRSPENTPFVDALPIPHIMQPVMLNPAPTRETNRVPSAVTGYMEAQRPDHQRWEQFLPMKMYESVERAVRHDFYPDIDGVPPSTVWTFVEASTGIAGPLRIKARYGEPVVHRIHNALPEDNGGFGINKTSTHLHNGHSASESDGGPLHFYDAGLFKDFHWANVRAGFASTHPETSLNGRTVPGDVRETMSFLWFHDHMHDFTAQNTYKGLVSLYTLFSDDINLDTDDETTGLRLPSGEFDIPMVFADKAFDPTTGQLFFDLFDLDGMLGDKDTVNGVIQPYLEVKRRKYRFRFLVGGPSRVYEFFLSNGQAFAQLSTDGNLLPRPLYRKSIRLQVAERVDVIVDFSKARPGETIYLENRLEQTGGRAPTGKLIAPKNLVQFRVTDDAPDESRIPAVLLDLPDRNVMISKEREWIFDRQGGAWAVNNVFFDPEKFAAVIRQNSAELWAFKSAGGWVHPGHPHLEEFQIVDRGGMPPRPEEAGRKDMLPVGDAVFGTDNSAEARIFLQFRDWLGDYPMHCHNTVHEDHGMMVLFNVVP